jgi:plasmid stability protein
VAQVIVRNLEDAVKRKLERRAVRHGRSMEEEIRDILR